MQAIIYWHSYNYSIVIIVSLLIRLSRCIRYATGGTDIDTQSANDLKTRDMDKYVCIICGYIYDPAEGDPESGIAPGTAFEDIPEDWTCPACGVGKEHFEKWNG